MTEMRATGRKAATPWKIGLGIFLLVMAATNSARPQANSSAEAVGMLLGVTVLVALGVRLIVSGLPKNLGDATFVKVRRHAWYKLMGLGFLVMAASALMFAWLSLVGASVLIVYAYWFGWTWISWRMADRQTLARVPQSPAG